MHIILNGRTVCLEDEDDGSFLDYGQIATLSGRSPDKVLTVVYDNAPHVCGSLTNGEKVKIHNGMIFYVGDTSNA